MLSMQNIFFLLAELNFCWEKDENSIKNDQTEPWRIAPSRLFSSSSPPPPSPEKKYHPTTEIIQNHGIFSPSVSPPTLENRGFLPLFLCLFSVFEGLVDAVIDDEDLGRRWGGGKNFGHITLLIFYTSRLSSFRRKSKIPIVINPFSSMLVLMSSFIMINFLKESFNRLRDFFSCVIFSGEDISKADWM